MTNIAQSSDEPGRQIPARFFKLNMGLGLQLDLELTLRSWTLRALTDSAAAVGYMIRQNLMAVVKIE